MNKKALFIAFMLLAIPIISVIPAYAGKGQNVQDFELFFQGLPIPTGDQWEAGGNTIHKDFDYNVLADFYVQVGATVFSKDYLEYEAKMSFVTHTKPEQFFTVQVREIISIYSSTTVHNDTTLRGTLEIVAIGTNRVDNGGTFVGFGTGEFEGVKIKGVSDPLVIVFTNPDPPNYYTQLTRTGIVMGWST